MTRRLILCLAIALRFASAQQDSLEQAWTLAAQGKRDDAVVLLRRMMTKAPGNADVRLLLGNLLIEAGDGQGAVKELTEASHLRPKSAEAENSLGEAYKSLGNTKTAEDHFARAVALNAAFEPAQLNLGEALLARNDLPDSALHLDRAIRLAGNKDDAADAHYWRATVYTKGEDSQKAADELQAAVKIRPSFPEAWSDLGQAQQILGQDDKAVAAFEKAVQLAPSDAVAQYRLGAQYLRMNKPAQAIQPLRAAYAQNPLDQSTLNALQSALRATGQMEEAKQVKAELSALLHDKDKQNQNALTAVRLNNEGAALEKNGALTAAIDKYKQALQLAPEHNGIRVNCAVALLRTGNWTEGLNLLHEAAQRDPDNAQLQAALRDALSQAPPELKPNWSSPELR
jgi:protein O-GlcNAc transferase